MYASSEMIDLRTLQFGLVSTRSPSTTSERVTNLHIPFPEITRGTLARPLELKVEKMASLPWFITDSYYFIVNVLSIAFYYIINEKAKIIICTERTCDIIFMKMKVIWFCPQKTISGSYLQQNDSDLVCKTRTIFLKWVTSLVPWPYCYF